MIFFKFLVSKWPIMCRVDVKTYTSLTQSLEIFKTYFFFWDTLL